MISKEQLIFEGFDLVPRDDRLFDIFPHLTRHRGIELWEKWTESEIELVAVKFQDPRSEPQILKFPRQEIEIKLLRR